jgi:hypothetical protein
MRGYDRPQNTMLTLVNPEQREPAHHPIRLIKKLAEVALKKLSPLFEQMYSEVGRPSPRVQGTQCHYRASVRSDSLADVAVCCEPFSWRQTPC